LRGIVAICHGRNSHGTVDKATRPHGSLTLIEAAGAEDKTLQLYDGHFHDLPNDLDRETVMTDIPEWLDTRSGGITV
jgi:alpha-beta hydrolase superfamily lysophospholipase